MTIRLSLSAVSYRAGSATILEPTTIDFGAGRLVAIVGPNGAGKSTLLRLLGGELIPTTGRVTIDGKPLSNFTDQELALLRSLLTHEGPIDIPYPSSMIVALGRTPHRHRADNSAEHDRAFVAAAMEHLSVTRLADRLFATLSGGERSLVSLARVFAQDTPVVLLDEPTGFLDVAFEEHTMRLIREHARSDRIVVAVVHDLNVVARHADRCVVMSKGRVVADGLPPTALTSELLSEVYEHPIHVVEHPLRAGPLILVE